MDETKRIAGDYEIVKSVHVGEKEIVFGEDDKNANGKKYMVAYCEQNELFANYTEVLSDDNYAEIMKHFGLRITEQAEQVMEQMKQLDVPLEVIMIEQCHPNDYKESIDGKVIAIDARVLRPEYQRADSQLHFVTGGFGANANSRGSAVFCVNIHTGKHTRWERRDVLGVVKDDALPVWAKEKLKTLSTERAKDTKDKER